MVFSPAYLLAVQVFGFFPMSDSVILARCQMIVAMHQNYLSSQFLVYFGFFPTGFPP